MLSDSKAHVIYMCDGWGGLNAPYGAPCFLTFKPVRNKELFVKRS